ncbi:MAG: HDIG domain-containing protein [Desulfobacterales bacterium]|jgi:uncharacterized protein|nr:HDIG domain-containing protein [Desulfobacteraceae bacterium]MBT4364189.1 HDIG domain-containing protein [Desulfobacteraceae bacterium]MBT7085973.1 HDIG domain-containing protein [Desulfobacterales bacterium]MBT7697983.1 HDIG domain-containing protein [Desulfobacterales bacterium]
MNINKLIEEYYEPGTMAYDIFLTHAKQVSEKAVDIAKRFQYVSLDTDFIKSAAFLHDIGMCMTDSPEIGCHGEHPYVCHGYLGREILESRGFPMHGMVCERHLGIGISVEDIKAQKLPLPERDMKPVTMEEQIICYADKFFSKSSELINHERSVDEVMDMVKNQYGEDKLSLVKSWINMFS